MTSASSLAPTFPVAVSEISDEALSAAARVLARVAVAEARRELGLDLSDEGCEDVGNHNLISGPAGATNTDGAEEPVI
jgi:hypothetical protein